MCNCETFNKERTDELLSRIEEHKKKPGPLMPTIHDAQHIFGCVPIEVQKIISEQLDVSVAKINGVVTFYSQFSLEPKGKHIVGVCMGTACYVKGSQGVLDAIKNEIGVEVGETSEDGEFTVEATRCIGACGLAPVFTVGEEVYGNTTVGEAKEIIKGYINNEA